MSTVDGTLTAIDEQGQIIWQYQTGGPLFFSSSNHGEVRMCEGGEPVFVNHLVKYSNSLVLCTCTSTLLGLLSAPGSDERGWMSNTKARLSSFKLANIYMYLI